MAKIDTYLDLAAAAYNQQINHGFVESGFGVEHVEPSTSFGSGLQAVVFKDAREIIVAFSGTQGNLFSAPISQNLANVRIGVGAIPNMAGRAHTIVSRYADSDKYISLVGHSLGGALAQVIGAWTGLPFVSFNGPGMKTHLSLARYNVLQRRQRARSRETPSGGSIGICFNTSGDFVGSFGSHIGKVVTVPGSSNRNHDLTAIRSGLGARVYLEPYDFLSTFIDPGAIGVAI